MKDIIRAKKQSPILGLTGMGGGVGSNLGGSLAEKTYVDDVFSNWAYRGTNAASQLEANGIDLAGEGGLVWIKDRDAANNHVLFDTERLPSQMLRLGGTTAGNEDVGAGFWGAASNGFTHGNWDGIGQVKDYASWTFRNQDGFFKVVKWTGNGVSGRQIAHGLGSTPGFVMTKALDNSDAWRTLHSWDFSKMLYISSDATSQGSASAFNGSVCDATHLTVTNDGAINANGQDYIAYVFAGGPSSAATARSVDFDGSDDYLSLASSSDFNFGTDDFTVEGWCYRDGGFFTMFDHLIGGDEFIIFSYDNGDMRVYSNSGGGHLVSGKNPGNKQWFHLAVVRASGKLRIYINGTHYGAAHNFTKDITQAGIQIGRSTNGAAYTNGRISNLRVVKGTAVYTSSFTPSTVPLTSISGTVLLCCNDSSVTGKTTGGTITATGDPTAITDSPFLDPDGYKFGEDGDQNLIKCGSYTGNTSIAPEINCGWEPSFILIKCTSQGTSNWSMYDNIRGIITGGNENYLYPNLANTEYSADRLELTPTGFKVVTGGGVLTNVNGGNYIYVAIRRSDGYVGKPAEAGTDVFNVIYGTSSANPTFAANFPVDFAFQRKVALDRDFYTGARLTGNKNMRTNTTAAEETSASSSTWKWDYMDGWHELSADQTDNVSWHWKRHAGFDVLSYQGISIDVDIPHSLGKTPEMYWIKKRNSVEDWAVYHVGMNGGSNPEGWLMKLNSTNAQDNAGGSFWFAPTSTHLRLKSAGPVNFNGNNYVAMLFASVEGISKVGYYDGSGSDVTVTTGFQPRFVIIKATNNARGWTVMDTTRGWGSGVDNKIMLNDSGAQVNTWDYGTPTSTGFTVSHSQYDINYTGWKYIYYAHA